jgi:two-component system CheB/CheR fusion protein
VSGWSRSDRQRGSGESGGERPDAEGEREPSVGVTRFFRDEEVWDAVAARVLPAITRQKRPGDVIRIWVPGCSTGEEAYSFAIVLAEHLGEALGQYRIRIFATDTDRTALERARLGVFPERIAAEISAPRVERFFVRHDDAYEVSHRIRDLILFAGHDVTTDPPFSRLDVVSCRNLLIYLGPVVQKEVLRAFDRALSPSGFLLLGGAETATDLPDPFSLLDAQLRIYAKRWPTQATPFPGSASAAPATRVPAPPARRDPPRRPAPPGSAEGLGSTDDLSGVQRRLLGIIEQLECSNEGLQSTIEELECSNEELQTINDELQSARDALQFANDELSSSVDELGTRTADLRHARDDVDNIFNAVRAAVVIVGLDGKIRRFNGPAGQLCGLGPADVGLPLARLARPLGPKRLEVIVWQVVEQLVPFDGEEAGVDDARYALRVVPYKTAERAIRGAVISLARVVPESRNAELDVPLPLRLGSEPS